MQILSPWVNRELQNNPITEKQKQHDLKKEWKNKQSRRHYKDKVEKKLTEGQGHGVV